MKPLTEWWAALDRSHRSALGVAALAVVLLVVVVITSSGIGRQTAVPVVQATATAAADPTSVAVVVEPKPTETGVPTVTSLKELKERFGDPPTAKRGRLRVPGLGIDAPLGVRSVPASLDMPSPTGPADVVLYDFSVAPHYGGMPGQGGNEIGRAHV